MLRSHTATFCCLLWAWSAACHTSSDSEPRASEAEVEKLVSAAAPEPANSAQRLVQAYLRVQLKLARDDRAGAQRAFALMSTAVKEPRLQLDPLLRGAIEGACAQGAAASEIAAMRSAFASLSTEMLRWLSAAENPLPSPLIVAHCPMALDNKGSKWLQLGQKLQNPYFGAEMLTCGNVEHTLGPHQKLPGSG